MSRYKFAQKHLLYNKQHALVGGVLSEARFGGAGVRYFLWSIRAWPRTFTPNIWGKVSTFSRLSPRPPRAPPRPRDLFRVRVGRPLLLSNLTMPALGQITPSPIRYDRSKDGRLLSLGDDSSYLVTQYFIAFTLNLSDNGSGQCGKLGAIVFKLDNDDSKCIYIYSYSSIIIYMSVKSPLEQ